MPSVPGFLPSTSGFRFSNRDFPRTPLVRMGMWGPGFGDISKGLCGGMVFAVRDYFEGGLAPPADTSPPPEGSGLLRYLKRRLWQSWRLPFGLWKYLYFQLPAVSSGRALGSIREQEWPRVKSDIDAGRLSTLGLVRVKSWNPRKLTKHHQVLAYGYEEAAGGQAGIRVYDPNFPLDDELVLSLGTSDIGYSKKRRVYYFFRSHYHRETPPVDSPGR
jgi:hypothetical protein